MFASQRFQVDSQDTHRSLSRVTKYTESDEQITIMLEKEVFMKGTKKIASAINMVKGTARSMGVTVKG